MLQPGNFSFSPLPKPIFTATGWVDLRLFWRQGVRWKHPVRPDQIPLSPFLSLYRLRRQMGLPARSVGPRSGPLSPTRVPFPFSLSLCSLASPFFSAAVSPETSSTVNWCRRRPTPNEDKETGKDDLRGLQTAANGLVFVLQTSEANFLPVFVSETTAKNNCANRGRRDLDVQNYRTLRPRN